MAQPYEHYYITPAKGVVCALLGICQWPLCADATDVFGSVAATDEFDRRTSKRTLKSCPHVSNTQLRLNQISTTV